MTEEIKQRGALKRGTHLLFSNSAEYFVMAELLRREIITGLLPRNTPNYDIIAFRNNKTAKIRVKSKAHTSSGWQWEAKGHPNFNLKDITNDDFVILVNLTQSPNQPEYFIFKSKEIEEILQKEFHEWINKLGKNNRPHDPNNKHRTLEYKDHKNLLESRKNKWDMLWE